MGPIMTIVKKAYDLIQDPERWCQGVYSKDINGTSCKLKEGHMFCAYGALVFVADKEAYYINDDTYKAHALIQRTCQSIFGKALFCINDEKNRETAHRNVCKVFKTALERWPDSDPSESDYEVRK